MKLLDKADASYSLIDNVGTVFYFQTDLDAPRGRVIAIDVSKPEKENWKTIVPESGDAIASVSTVNNQLAVHVPARCLQRFEAVRSGWQVPA